MKFKIKKENFKNFSISQYLIRFIIIVTFITITIVILCSLVMFIETLLRNDVKTFTYFFESNNSTLSDTNNINNIGIIDIKTNSIGKRANKNKYSQHFRNEQNRASTINSYRNHFARSKRTKRFIVFNGGGVAKLIFGISLPIQMKVKDFSLSEAYNLQAVYSPPPRPLYWWSIFNTTTFAGRKRNKILDCKDCSRSFVYNLIEFVLESNGLPGKDCLLTAICDIGSHPFLINYFDDFGFLHAAFNAIFSPKYMNAEDIYLNAYEIGIKGKNCTNHFNNCPSNGHILDRISVLI